MSLSDAGDAKSKKLIKLRQALEIVGLSRTSYNMDRSLLPAPIRRGQGPKARLLFVEGEVYEIVDQLIAQRDEGDDARG